MIDQETAKRICGVLCAAWYKADNRALRAMPGSPRQAQLRALSKQASEDYYAFRAAFPDCGYVAPHER